MRIFSTALLEISDKFLNRIVRNLLTSLSRDLFRFGKSRSSLCGKS